MGRQATMVTASSEMWPLMQHFSYPQQNFRSTPIHFSSMPMICVRQFSTVKWSSTRMTPPRHMWAVMLVTLRVRTLRVLPGRLMLTSLVKKKRPRCYCWVRNGGNRSWRRRKWGLATRRLRSRKVKCLGVVIDEGLKWQEHIGQVRRKCLSGLAKLRRMKDDFQPRRSCMTWSSFHILTIARTNARFSWERRWRVGYLCLNWSMRCEGWKSMKRRVGRRSG